MKLFRHYKGGIYQVLTEGTHTETEEKMVVYRDGKYQTWIRPADMFFGEVELNGEIVRRFTPIEK